MQVFFSAICALLSMDFSVYPRLRRGSIHQTRLLSCANTNINHRAWIFAAGLVLGFSILVHDGADTASRDAFKGAQRVLGSFRRLSAQADQYYHILANFSDAIDAYRAQVRRERRTATPALVERIFSMEPMGREQVSQDAGTDQLARPNGTPSDDPVVSWQDCDTANSVSSGTHDQWAPPAGDDVMLQLFWDRFTAEYGDMVYNGMDGSSNLPDSGK
jgi:hypothetical protein